MKVFYTASVEAPNIELVKRIYFEIEKLGYENTEDYVLRADRVTNKTTDNEYWRGVYADSIRNLARAEVGVFEATAKSSGLGQLVQECIRREKPTILLSQTPRPPMLFAGTAVEEKRVQLIDYDEDNIVEVLKYGLEYAKDLLNVRFTMLLGPRHAKYLDKINEEKGVSRSDFIRRLIDKEMANEG